MKEPSKLLAPGTKFAAELERGDHILWVGPEVCEVREVRHVEPDPDTVPPTVLVVARGACVSVHDATELVRLATDEQIAETQAAAEWAGVTAGLRALVDLCEARKLLMPGYVSVTIHPEGIDTETDLRNWAASLGIEVRETYKNHLAATWTWPLGSKSYDAAVVVRASVHRKETSAEVSTGTPAAAQVGMPARSVPLVIGVTGGTDHPTTAVEVEEPPSADGRAESGSDALVRHCGAGVVDGESAPAPAAPDSRSGAAGVTPAMLSLALLNAAQTGQLVVGAYLSEAALAAVLEAGFGTAFHYPGGGKPGPVGFILEDAGREHLKGLLGPCGSCRATLSLSAGVYVDEAGVAHCDASGRPEDGHWLGDPYIDFPTDRDLAETSGPAVATAGPSGDSSGEVETGQGTAEADPSARDSASPVVGPARWSGASYNGRPAVILAKGQTRTDWFFHYAAQLDKQVAGWHRDPLRSMDPRLALEATRRREAESARIRKIGESL